MRRLEYGEYSLTDFLTIAKERGIISGDERNRFIFSTAFYNNAFCFKNCPVDSHKWNSPLFEEMNKNNSSLTTGTYVHFLSMVNINRISTPNVYVRLRAETLDYDRFSKIEKLKLFITALFHDVGKPLVAFERKGRTLFYNHTVESREIAEKELLRRDLEECFLNRILFYIEHHDAFISFKFNNEKQKFVKG